MKRVFCLFLTLVMVFGCGVYAFAAETAAKYQVSNMEDGGSGFLRGSNGDVVGFQLSSDGRTVDMNKPISMGGGSPLFGKDIYIPLVNKSYDLILDINKKIEKAQEEYGNAEEALEQLNTKHRNLDNAIQSKSNRESDLKKVNTHISNCVSYSTATNLTEINEINSLVDRYKNKSIDVNNYDSVDASSKLNEVKTVIENQITTLDSTIASNGGSLTSVEAEIGTAQATLESKLTALNNAKSELNQNQYWFVNEAKAVGAGDSYKSKLSVKGIGSSSLNSLTKKYINPDNIELVKMKAIYTGNDNKYYGLGENDLSTNRIYFIKIPLASTSKKVELDDPLEGTVFLKKTTGADENKFEIYFEFYLFPEFNMASSIDNKNYSYVTKDLQWYEEGSGFESYDEWEFRFTADDRSFFVVDTSRQTKAIQLSFNKDWNEAEQEYLDAHEGYNFDYDFYNGYSSSNFTRQGTLYLYWSDDEDYNKAYVYYIDDANNKALTLVASGRPDGGDWYEDGCFTIKTNKLGRYLISSKQLSITHLMDLPGPTQEELDAQAAAEAEAARIKAEQEEAARKAAEEEAARKAAEEAARKAAEEEAARLAEEAKKAAEEQQVKPITPAIEKDEGMPIIAWVAIVGGIILVVIAVGVMFYTRGNSKKNSSESSNSNKNNSNKRRML